MKNILNNFLTPEQQKVILFLLSFAFIGLLAKYSGLTANQSKQTASMADSLNKDYEIKYDLQTITNSELQMIPGIGPSRAEDIIRYRDSLGFAKPTDLLNVKGIGEKTYEKIKDYFIGANSLTNKSMNELKEKKKININKASIDELTALPGIGPAKAKKIVNYRIKNGYFDKKEDIMQVNGIGQKTLEKLKPLISLE
ncbi:MAG: ComEA family DNA-binding protein [Candidatus Cloacimonadota bacterium]|nr:ComEA family DNA-binding protein [Candidatus Cloacimonadota bacterium]